MPSGVANRQLQIDVATFMQWVDAYAGKEAELAAFYRKRFRPEFKPAVEAWIATRPLKNRGAADALRDAGVQARGAGGGRGAGDEGRRSLRGGEGRHPACRQLRARVVLFATSLFFGGISVRMNTRAARVALLGLGYLVFVGTLVWLATFPVSIAV